MGKDYNAARAEAAGAPICFTLGYTDATRTTPREWSVRRDVPQWTLLDLMAKASDAADAADDAAAAIPAIAAFTAFLRSVFVGDDDQWKAFEQTLLVERVPLETIQEIVYDIIAEATGRPFEQQPSSPGSPSTSGLPSKVVSLSAASTATA